MGEVFFKSLKWFLFVTFFIGGVASIRMIEVLGFETAILAVFSFGAAYLMSGPWRSLPKFPMALSIILIAAGAYAAQYILHYIYIYFGIRLNFNYYTTWIGLMFFVGTPVMMFVFAKYD